MGPSHVTPQRSGRGRFGGRAATTRRISRSSADQTSRLGVVTRSRRMISPWAPTRAALRRSAPTSTAITQSSTEADGSQRHRASRAREPRVRAGNRGVSLTSVTISTEGTVEDRPAERSGNQASRFAQLFEAVVGNVSKVLLGQGRRRATGDRRAARRRPPPDRGRAGRRQDEPGQGDRRVRRLHVEPGAVHTRPAAERHRRCQRLPAQRRGVPLPAGPDLRQHRARRRDQPRLAEDPVGAARGDGGTSGHRRRHAVRAAPAVHGDRHAEPDRAGRHVPAAREPARPVHDQAVDRLPRPARPARHPRRPRLDRHAGDARARWSPRTSCWR